MRVACYLLLAACSHASAPVPSHRTGAGEPDDPRCGMIEALMRYPTIEKFACGQAATDESHRKILDVHIEPPLRAACDSREFALYRGQAMNTDALLVLHIDARGGIWSVTVSFTDPPSSPNDAPQRDGGFTDINYYCHLIAIRAAHGATGWRVWEEPLPAARS